MSIKAEFYVPGNDILCKLGRVQVLHSQLDHTLRLAIKRMLGISIDDAGYWNETHGMTKALRDRTRKLIKERYRDDVGTVGTLNKVIDDAESATKVRNRVFHSVWMKSPGQEPVLHDRDNKLKMHVNFSLPTAEELASLCKRIEQVQRALNHLTKQLL